MLYHIYTDIDTSPLHWGVFDRENAFKVVSWLYYGTIENGAHFTIIDKTGQRYTLKEFCEFIKWDGVRI